METTKEKNYLIAFLVDHATPETFFNFIDEGHAPHVSKYILGNKNEDGTYSKATISRNCCTGYPSTSANSHTSLMTGANQGKTGLLYHQWWDLTKKKPEFIDSGKMSISMLQDYNYKFISRNVKTIFEYYDKSASFHAINRGATFKLLTPFSVVKSFLPLLFQLKAKDDPGKPSPLADPAMWRDIFQKYVGRFLQNVKEEGMYEASYIVFLLSDENGHLFGFDSDQYEEAVQILDHFVKGMVEGIEDKKGNHIEGLKELGILDNMNWCICTDHGGREIDRTKIITVNTILERELGLRLLEGHEEMSDNVLKEIKKKYSKLNGFSTVGAEVYHAWYGGPKGEELGDFTKFYGESYFRALMPKKPIKLRDVETESVDLIDYLINQDYTQFVIIPEEQDPENQPIPQDTAEREKKQIPREYVIKIFSKSGKSLIERKLENGEVVYKYSIVKGDDPLDYTEDKTGLKYGQYFTQEKWLEKTIKLELPDVFFRLFGFLDSVYAPNFITTSDFNYSYWSIFEVAKKKKKALKNHQNHDGLYSCESIVPVTFAGPDFNNSTEIPYVRNVDIIPTLLKAMKRPYKQEEIDGIARKEAIK